MPAVEIGTVATALATAFGGVDGVEQALDYEPATAKKMPMVSVMFAGFARSGLESANVAEAPISDPIGGRAWIWKYEARLWVALGSDEEAAQEKVQRLTKALVLAVESDPSLGAIADDAAVSSGRVDVARPKTGKAYLVVTLPTFVEITESV